MSYLDYIINKPDQVKIIYKIIYLHLPNKILIWGRLIHNPNEPMGNNFTQITGKAQSTTRQCLAVLQKKDFIYKVTRDDPGLLFITIGQYRILDPLTSTFLRKLS